MVKRGSGTGNCVLYVMRRDQRVSYNHALLVAQQIALTEKLPLAVVFCLQPHTLRRSHEQYDFMLKGLAKVEKKLAEHNVPLLTLIGQPQDSLAALVHHTSPHSVVFDFSPLRGHPRLIEEAKKFIEGAVIEVDTHNIVPVWETSTKQEIGARTLRPKTYKLLDKYLTQPPKIKRHPHSWSGVVMKLEQLSPQISELLKGLAKSGVSESPESGEIAASKVMDDFIANRLSHYATGKNNPVLGALSNLSPYLHFGQISSLEISMRVYQQLSVDSSLQQSADAFLEELIIRKELSDNFCYYNHSYDSLKGAPAWAQKTLADHGHDVREFTYSFEQLTNAKTHDSAWNACQKQLTTTGKMHGYMRMYWAKKILEWTQSPAQAIEYALQLNDFYSWDGGDPNGYVGILWAIAGLHDRPWFDRPIYGTVRYMNYNGLKRKFDIASYEAKWT